MGTRLTYAPVYYVVGQVRFNAVLTMEKYLPAIQEKLRKADYPDFERGVGMNMNFLGQVPTFEQSPRFQFLNAKRTAGFVLEPSGLAFQTTEYDTFDPFLATLLTGLEAVHSEASLTYSERIGIRYLDAVTSKDGDTLEQYLSPTVTAFTAAVTDGGRELVHSISETRSKQGNSMLVSRAFIVDQASEGVAFPPELQGLPLKVGDKFSKIKGLYAILDTDSWLEERQDFALDNLEKQLCALKDNIGFSFDLMVTNHARDSWK